MHPASYSTGNFPAAVWSTTYALTLRPLLKTGSVVLNPHSSATGQSLETVPAVEKPVPSKLGGPAAASAGANVYGSQLASLSLERLNLEGLPKALRRSDCSGEPPGRFATVERQLKAAAPKGSSGV